MTPLLHRPHALLRRPQRPHSGSLRFASVFNAHAPSAKPFAHNSQSVFELPWALPRTRRSRGTFAYVRFLVPREAEPARRVPANQAFQRSTHTVLGKFPRALRPSSVPPLRRHPLRQLAGVREEDESCGETERPDYRRHSGTWGRRKGEREKGGAPPSMVHSAAIATSYK